jgi:hypothetical protein
MSSIKLFGDLFLILLHHLLPHLLFNTTQNPTMSYQQQNSGQGQAASYYNQDSGSQQQSGGYQGGNSNGNQSYGQQGGNQQQPQKQVYGYGSQPSQQQQSQPQKQSQYGTQNYGNAQYTGGMPSYGNTTVQETKQEAKGGWSAGKIAAVAGGTLAAAAAIGVGVHKYNVSLRWDGMSADSAG